PSGKMRLFASPGVIGGSTAALVGVACLVLAWSRLCLCQLGVPLEAVEEAVRIARSVRALVMLDPGPPAPLPNGLIAQLDVIRPNASEAQILTGIRVRDRNGAREAARDLLRRGVKTAVV